MKYKWLICSLLIACTSGCQTNSIHYPPGGYDYLKEIAANDSDYYCLPIRKLVPLVDSMQYADEKYFYKSFAEPNISLKPADEDIFRLCITGFDITETIITLTKKRLLVKQTKKGNEGSIYPEENYQQLTEIEKQHYFFLKKFFPFGKRTYTRGRQLYIDSMIQSDARLLDANYYRYLINKVIDKDAPVFEYASKTISLAQGQFDSLVNRINASGYWSLPYVTELQEEQGTDGWGFSLEANTRHKYNLVACSGTVKTKGTLQFKQACQQILNYAQVGNDVEIWNPDREK